MDREKFDLIIKKAEANGYKDHLGMLPVLPMCKTSADILMSKIFWQRRYEIIFSHSFAKAFWGEQEHYYIDNKYTGNCKYCTAYYEDYVNSICEFCWQEHLSNMVLEKDPLEYLGRFLDE